MFDEIKVLSPQGSDAQTGLERDNDRVRDRCGARGSPTRLEIDFLPDDAS